MNLLPNAKASFELAQTIGTSHDVRDELTAMIELHGSQKAVAAMLGISGAYLHDVLHGRRDVSQALAEKVGMTKVSIFVRTRPT